jgi:hypothetical protein
MKIQDLTIGQRVKHPQYGVGTVNRLNEQTAEIRFDDATRTIDPVLAEVSPAEPTLAISGLDIPLTRFVETLIETLLPHLGYENPNAVVGRLGTRWHKGRMVLHPADPTLQTKEVSLEVFFHKLVGLRNQLRVLEQKINGHPTLTDGDKVEMQQYVTRCYGSLTTFNLLFSEKEDQF